VPVVDDAAGAVEELLFKLNKPLPAVVVDVVAAAGFGKLNSPLPAAGVVAAAVVEVSAGLGGKLKSPFPAAGVLAAGAVLADVLGCPKT